jgi:hypothetical protein
MRKADSDETTSSIKTPVTSDDAPKLAQKDFDKARFRVGGKEASRAEWQAATRARVGKLRINIMLDAPIVEHSRPWPASAATRPSSTTRCGASSRPAHRGRHPARDPRGAGARLISRQRAGMG